jgi:hypothetical protein
LWWLLVGACSNDEMEEVRTGLMAGRTQISLAWSEGGPWKSGDSASVVVSYAGTFRAVCLSFRAACVEWREPGTLLSVVLPQEEGGHLLRAWAVDKAGEVVVSPPLYLGVDRTPPEPGQVGVVVEPEGLRFGWTGFRDVGSGVAWYALIRASGPFAGECGEGPYLWEGTAIGAQIEGGPGHFQSYGVCAWDRAGNVGLPGRIWAGPDPSQD